MTTIKTFSAAALLAAAALAAVPSSAQEAGGHAGHGAASDSNAADHPSVSINMAAIARMHEAMAAIDYSGDPDVDFARGMIPHHQAAIDMAKIQLEHGKDADMRALAEEIVAAQQREIAELEAWLAENDVE